MSDEFDVEQDVIEFDAPLSRTSYISLFASLGQQLFEVLSDWCGRLFEITAAHSDWERLQREAKDASDALKKLLEGNDG